MKTYAMICNNRVIEVLYNQEAEPKWPPDPAYNTVIAVECSAEATIDWLYNAETGEVFEPVFIEPEEPEEPEVFVNEYEQYYNMVNSAILGGE